LAHVADLFLAGEYVRWKGDSERTIGWQSGCCVLVRGEVLRQLGGFDPQFFYSYEEVDLCRRIWDSGYPILFTPRASITHLGGQSVNRFPIRFVLETYRSRYRYFYKHHGKQGARRSQLASIAWIRVRQIGYGLLYLVKRTDSLKRRLEIYRVALQWNRELDPVKFAETGEEPKINFTAAAQAA
jgi:GT2 family glycosyltransferase